MLAKVIATYWLGHDKIEIIISSIALFLHVRSSYQLLTHNYICFLIKHKTQESLLLPTKKSSSDLIILNREKNQAKFN
jgi:hypothetical protein